MAQLSFADVKLILCQIGSAKARQDSTWQSRTPIQVSSLGGSRQCAIPTEQRNT
jgi:hypothetical protein